MTLSERNNISIAQIVIYAPSLLIAIWLALRHGFGRNAGWFFLIVFSLARIIGASLQLATIADPTNLSLHIGAATLQNVGLTPLIMVQVSLVGRALGSIRKTAVPFVTEQRLRVVQLVALVGMILSAVGGSDSSQSYASTGVYTVSGTSQAGIGLVIAAYVLLVFSTLLVVSQLSQVEMGEKRLVLAVGLSLPFILVRLIYSAISVFAHNPAFNQLTGDINVQLGMAVIMEMIVVIIVESIGMTLQRMQRVQVATASRDSQSRRLQSEDDHEMGAYR